MLSKETCEACRVDAPRLSDNEIKDLLSEVDGWEVIHEEGQNRLHRVFKVSNFVKAQEFANSIGDYAEQVGHHPRLIVEWGCLTVTWWSHKIGGLHRNDFICAARTSELLGQ
ncbi:4a-hydroxytetrahydrobiopterin dehydratase [Oleiphilus sp. HI0009]|nr:4a-hydroxytetrahydrobiopterin dehydratase [Oleiphilus sp. HI0009]